MIPSLVELETGLESVLNQAGNPAFGSVMLDCRPVGTFNVEV